MKKGDKTGGDNHVTEKEQTLTPHHHQPDPGMDVKGTISRVVRKPDFCICENKDADQLLGFKERTIPLFP